MGRWSRGRALAATNVNDPGTAWAQALAAFQARLAAGLEVLAGADPDLAPGCTPRECLFERDRLRLYRYGQPGTHRGPPLLIVYALVNRPGMLDLEPERSLVRGLLAAGLDVWLIEWGDPDASDSRRPLADYVLDYLHACVGEVARRSGGAGVNLLGVCQGGVLSLLYATLRPQALASLTTTVTPVDFHTPEDRLSAMVRGIDVDALVDTFGNVPGTLLNSAFLSLKPFELGVGKYLAFTQRMHDRAAMQTFLRMERWIFDSPAQPGRMFREFVRDCYQRNALARGEMTLAGERVDLSTLAVPVLNIYAEADHLVPPAASRALGPLVGDAGYEELACPGGHIGIYVGSGARRAIPAAVARHAGATV